jgi:hypothetical protein|tara:strand:- start:1400 stop:1882 length:483 start_codon:yes stop_codon:yes gene_type:complete
MSPRHLVALLLALSAINLALMIPGGFVETRDFSAYPAIVLAGFNIFLTVLGLGSLVLAWLTWRGGVRRGWSMAAAIGFAATYLLDLFAIFPVTLVPMSSLLETLEWLGTGLAVLLGVAVLAAGRGEGDAKGAAIPRGLGLVLAIAGIGIVVFATIAAMGG